MLPPSSLRPELMFDIHLDLGEGPIWDDRRKILLFADIMQGHVHAYDPITLDHRVYDVGRPVGAIACTSRGDWLLAAGTGFMRLDPDSGRTTEIVDAAPGRGDIRMNDGYVDARGRFWAGTMSLVGKAEQGTLYRLDPDGAVHEMLTPVTTSNGIDWSPDGRKMYYIDTRTDRVDVFDFDEDCGVASGRRPFVTIAAARDGHPDGLVVDADGGVWVAFWEGGALRRYTSHGTLDRTFIFPADLVTKCAFGGTHLDTIYVTTARRGLTDEQLAKQPHAGSLFYIRAGFTGRRPNRFGG